jgi:cysteine synthase A
MKDWVRQAIAAIEADFLRSSDTHLIRVDMPAVKNIHLYLKDESTHPTGSLKHRLARSLFLYGLCNGWIVEGTTVVESSSGSTAVSEAYFARLLGLPFIAVVPKSTSREKIDQIGFYGGRCHFVAAADIYTEAARLASERNGHCRIVNRNSTRSGRLSLQVLCLSLLTGCATAPGSTRKSTHAMD